MNVTIELHRRTGPSVFALVDEEVLSEERVVHEREVTIGSLRWCAAWNKDVQTFYVVNVQKVRGRNRSTYLHRLVLAAPVGVKVDHINHDGLDNRRTNLRLATHSQNIANARKAPGTSRYKGVSLSGGKWRAQIRVEGQLHHLGLFPDEESAARAYEVAARVAFGEFALVGEAGR